jgi:hypothetical protein
MTALGLDTSVAIPLLVRTHRAHQAVVRWWAGREVALSGHALAETYSVLTRLPGDVRLNPADAARLLAARFSEPLLLGPHTAGRLPDVLGRLGIVGGAGRPRSADVRSRRGARRCRRLTAGLPTMAAAPDCHRC